MNGRCYSRESHQIPGAVTCFMQMNDERIFRAFILRF